MANMNTHALSVAMPATRRVKKITRTDDGLTRRERARLGREHRAAMMAPLSEAEEQALKAATLRRRAA